MSGDLISSSEAQPNRPDQRHFIQVCQYRTCRRAGAQQVLAAFEKYASPEVMVAAAGCLGQCGSGPNVRLASEDIWYCRVRVRDVPEVVQQLGQSPIRRLLHPRIHRQHKA
ncbi:MAG: (2Fe-2S) ferredoxin domain-containing protein [Leptolyngbya sp. SIO4C1]|nr:(2Fe-2S) ferredoxin domain-containing protein [Leptolyngbya sp. SIO4C1]